MHAGQQLPTVAEISAGQVEESHSAPEADDAQAVSPCCVLSLQGVHEPQGVQKQIKHDQALLLAMQAVQEDASNGKAQAVSAVELPVEAKTTMSNPVFQQEMDDTSDVEELH